MISPSQMRLASLPDDRNPVVRRATIHDPLGPSRFSEGDIALMVGTPLHVADASRLFSEASAAGVAMLAFRHPEDAKLPQRLAEMARTAGVAIALVAPDASWDSVGLLLNTAIRSLYEVDARFPQSLESADLFALCDEVAAKLGGPVTVTDPAYNIVAYSGIDAGTDELRARAILQRRWPSEWIHSLRNMGVMSSIFDNGVGIVDGAPQDDHLTRIIVRCATAEHLGTIGISRPRPLGDTELDLLRQAASVASLHVVRDRVTNDYAGRGARDHLLAVLDGRETADTLKDVLRPTTGQAFAVLAFDLQNGSDAARLSGLLEAYATAFRHQAVMTTSGTHVYMVLATTRTTSAQLAALGEDVLRHVKSALRAPARVGIGSSVASLGDIRRSRREADEVLQVLMHRDGGNVVATMDDVRSDMLMLELRELVNSRPYLLAGKLKALIDYDAENHSEMVKSVQAYLSTFGDIQEAAARLDVHANTVRYRIRRAESITGLRFDDPDERLLIELQLRLLDAAAAARPTDDDSGSGK
ncbi:CdaR family transcriptional regulator [Kribbella sp. VKM Ac-2566]|uniref:PucR family transcriptional regulator n=1 Tax=Kribbella sp. VKM Ac-2566 TaxID=2512218 RepID=UPI001416ED92|nr:helix-turn-helix domain-containing protein [Kribbella sp. VKM Ac-2566]